MATYTNGIASPSPHCRPNYPAEWGRTRTTERSVYVSLDGGVAVFWGWVGSGGRKSGVILTFYDRSIAKPLGGR